MNEATKGLTIAVSPEERAIVEAACRPGAYLEDVLASLSVLEDIDARAREAFGLAWDLAED